jgi:hypothetical protein
MLALDGVECCKYKFNILTPSPHVQKTSNKLGMKQVDKLSASVVFLWTCLCVCFCLMYLYIKNFKSTGISHCAG